MRLDEAIKHAEERAKMDCSDCAKEHRQLAKWLRELKLLRGKDQYDNGMLKTKLSEDGKVINFSLKTSDLKWLFKNSIENFEQSVVKRGREKEFIDYVLERLSEPSTYNDDTVKWLMPFEEIFLEILEGYEDFIEYKEQ